MKKGIRNMASRHPLSAKRGKFALCLVTKERVCGLTWLEILFYVTYMYI